MEENKGKNALFGENGEEKYKAFRLQAAKNGVKDGGYDEWAWKPVALIPTIDNPFYSDFVDSDDIDESKLTTENYNFHIRFEEPGTHVLGVSFLTSIKDLQIRISLKAFQVKKQSLLSFRRLK